jgi:hypothetical protein
MTMELGVVEVGHRQRHPDREPVEYDAPGFAHGPHPSDDLAVATFAGEEHDRTRSVHLEDPEPGCPTRHRDGEIHSDRPGLARLVGSTDHAVVAFGPDRTKQVARSSPCIDSGGQIADRPEPGRPLGLLGRPVDRRCRLDESEKVVDSVTGHNPIGHVSFVGQSRQIHGPDLGGVGQHRTHYVDNTCPPDVVVVPEHDDPRPGQIGPSPFGRPVLRPHRVRRGRESDPGHGVCVFLTLDHEHRHPFGDCMLQLAQAIGDSGDTLHVGDPPTLPVGPTLGETVPGTPDDLIEQLSGCVDVVIRGHDPVIGLPVVPVGEEITHAESECSEDVGGVAPGVTMQQDPAVFSLSE